MRKLAALIALVLTTAGIAFASPAGAATPTYGPASVAAYGSYDGITVSWSGYGSQSSGTAPTGAKVYRVDSPSDVLVGQGPITAGAGGIVTDTTTAAGTSQSYYVVPFDADGAGPASSTVSATRSSASAPPGGTENALSYDMANTTLSPAVIESVSGTPTVAHIPGFILMNIPAPHAFALAIVFSDPSQVVPGTIPIVAPAAASTPTWAAVNFGADTTFCGGTEAGAITLTDAGVRSDGTPDVLSGSYTVTCSSVVYTGVIRVNSTHTWAQGSAQPSVVSIAANAIGQVAGIGPVVVSNLGDGPLTMGGAATLSGPGAADWSVDSNACAGAVLTGPQTCDVDPLYTPSGKSTSVAVLHIPDGSLRGERTIALSGTIKTGSGTVTSVATGLYASGSYDGITVGWTGDSGNLPGNTPLQGDVYRTTGGGRVYVGTNHGNQSTGGSVTDTGAPVGVVQTYVVVLANDTFGTEDGPDSAPVTGTRSSGPSATPGTIDALSVDTGQVAAAYTANAEGTATVDISGPGYVGLNAAAPTPFRLVLGRKDMQPFVPGTYGVGDAAADPVSATLTQGVSNGCPHPQGSVTFTEADVRSDGTPDVLTGSYHFTGCNGADGEPVSGIIRLNSTHTWSQGLPASSPITTPATKAGTVSMVSAVISNLGTGQLTMGSAASVVAAPVAGSLPADWSVTTNGCAGVVLSGAATCTVSLSFHPSVAQQSITQLDVMDDSAQGKTVVELVGLGYAPPAPPSDLTASPTQRSIVLTWSGPVGGVKPVTSYSVYSVDTSGVATFLAKTTSGSYNQPAPAAGTVLRFAVSATNDAGEGPKSSVVTVTVPHRELVYAGEAGTSPQYRINREAADAPGQQLAVSDGAFSDDAPAVSPDGKTVAYSGSPTYSSPQSNLWLARLDGTSRVPLTSGAFVDEDPAWSPDGTMIAFDRTPVGSGSSFPVLYVVPAAGGTPQRIGSTINGFHPSWTQDGHHVVATQLQVLGVNNYAYSTVELAVNTTVPPLQATIAGGNGLVDPSVSPNGTTIAASTGSAIVTIPLGGGAVTTLASPSGPNGFADDPTWTPDGSTIYFDYASSAFVASQIWSVPAHGGAAQLVSSAAGDEFEPSVLQDDLIAPAVQITALAASTPSRAVSVPFTFTDADTPIGSVSTRCTLDGAAAALCTSPFVMGGLAGGIHELVITATDAHGLTGSAKASWTVNAGPVVRITAPTAKVLTTAKVQITWKSSGGHGAVTYAVRMQSLKGTTYGAPTTLFTGRRVTFDRALRAGTWCFSVRGTDTTGPGAWSAPRCITAPVKAKSVNISKAGVHYAHVAIVVQRCTGCGTVVVAIGGKKIGAFTAGGHGVGVVTFKLPAGRYGKLTVTATGARKAGIVGIALLS